MLLSIAEFIGHLHPVLVHLPIGILLLACLFLWQSRKDKSENLQKTTNFILLLGMISAIASCITGLVLARNGDYEEGMVNWHRWMGISVAVVSIFTFYSRRTQFLQKWQWILASLLLVLIFITGHLGGSLTHGTDYLTEPLANLSEEDTAQFKRRPIPNIQEAFAYNDIIQPIFHARCYTCHAKSRQKGKLRLDQPDQMMKGGKDGAVIVAGKPDESELVKRIFLPRGDDHHMAPKEKPQLTESEKLLIRWWIENGADFSKKVKDIQQTDKVKMSLVTLQLESQEEKKSFDIPESPVERADETAVAQIRKLGGLVLPVAQNSNYLEADFITSKNIRNSDIARLLPVSKQLVWLRLSGSPITDSAMAILAQCQNLSRLELDHTGITDQGLDPLVSLSQLQSLNLVDTKVTAAGVLKLIRLKKLRAIFLYQTNIDRKDWPSLKKSFPNAILDSGGYSVPLLNTDTIIVKPPKTVQ
ncbi:MAG: c-type cytochrome domain-containing protein [Chitinophagales bacterium]